jgi:hypothetical protein
MKLTPFLLGLGCVLVLVLRLHIALSTQTLSTDDAYFHLRQVEHVRNTGLPLFDDPLSYGGRVHVFTPVFHYVVAAGALFMAPVTAAKIIPNILAALLTIIIFGIVRRLSKNDGVALFIAVFSAFVPVWFGHTINTLSPETLAVPLLFFVLYSWLRVAEPRWRYLYLISLILLAFTHPIALLLVLGLILYLVLILVERLTVERNELEIALFSIFFVLWSQFLLYKKFILAHGPAVVWQNIPPQLLSTLFSDITVLTALYHIGIIPVLYGVFVMYRYLFRRKHKMTYFLIAFALSAGLLLWFRLIPLQLGLILLGMFLLVLFSKWVSFFLDRIPKTRLHRLKPVFIASLVLAFVLTSVLPSLGVAWAVQDQSLNPAGVLAYQWLRENVPSDAAVVAAVGEGHRVASLGERKNVIDEHFLLQRDAKQRLHDVNRVFTTTFGVEAVELMDRYRARAILLTPETKREHQLGTLTYAVQSKCFGRAFEESGYEIIVKHAYCTVEEVR